MPERPIAPHLRVVARAHRAAPCAPRRSGFSIIELLMVVAIITILMGLIGSAVLIVRQRVFRTNAASRIVQLQWAVDNYATEDRRHRFPEQTGPGDFSIRYDPSGRAPGNFNPVIALGHDIDLTGFDRSVPPPYPLIDPWKRPYQYRVDSDLITFTTPQRPLDLPGWNATGVRPWAYLWSTGRDGSTDGKGWIYSKESR